MGLPLGISGEFLRLVFSIEPEKSLINLPTVFWEIFSGINADKTAI